jgi:hypothetical protein
MDESLERLVRLRARERCEYGELPKALSRLLFEVDHVIARKHGGLTVQSNLCLACFACNHHKGANIAGIDPVTQKITSLFHPRRHRWRYHFRWDGPLRGGRTAIGRTTVAVLEINLARRVMFRQALIDEGVFPPDR